MLQGLSSYCGQRNLPGVQTIEYVPTAWVNTTNYEIIRNSANNWQYAIPLLGGATWLSMPLLPPRRNWSENGRVTNQGARYEQLLSGVVPKLRPEASLEIMEMEQLTFLVRMTDSNDKVWLIGQLQSPLFFRAQADSSDNNGLNNYAIRFEGVTALRSAGYVPVF